MNSTSADDKLDRGDLDPDEADRLASLIRPEWEEEDAAATAVVARAADHEVEAADREDRAADREDEAAATRIEPDRNVDVGDTLPTDMEPLLPKQGGSRAPAPVAASATRMGLGTVEDEVTARPTAVAVAAAVAATAVPAATVGSAAAVAPAAEGPADEVDEDLISTQARPIASVPPPAVASGAPSRRSAASMSRPTPVRIARAADDEPIELPVQAGNLTTKIAVAVAAALAVALVAVLATRGDAPPPPPAVTTAVTTAATPASTPTLVPPPIPASIPEEPTAAATAASARPSAAATAKAPPKEPSPAAEMPKGPSKPPQGGAKPPPPGGGAKPPPKPPAGGIIRDAPF